MRKKFLLIIFILTFTLTFNIFSFAAEINPNTEFNWYFVPRIPNSTPDPPKESYSLLEGTDSFYVGDTNNKVLYLTFDEGYERGNTSEILDILNELKVPAAFFVVKPFIDTQPELVKRMVDEGHLVCNHSSHHPSMPTVTDQNKFNSEFTEVEESYKALIGENMPKFFRPPMGKFSKNSLDRTKALGYKTIFWSFAYKDWLIKHQPDEKTAIAKIEKGAHPGAIILLHAVSDTNTKILKTVLTDLIDQGYEFKSLNEL
jgi:peptidoglycan-N-acetylmuramic acid deacetylase